MVILDHFPFDWADLFVYFLESGNAESHVAGKLLVGWTWALRERLNALLCNTWLFVELGLEPRNDALSSLSGVFSSVLPV